MNKAKEILEEQKYLKWRDYFVEMVEEGSSYDSERYWFYFRNLNWDLLWYICITDEDFHEWSRMFYVTSTVSSYKLEENVSKHPSRIEMMKENWYTWASLKGFWSTMLEEVLSYFQSKYPDSKKHVKMISYDENRPFTEALVNKTKEKTQWIIWKQYWWNEEYTCSFELL